MNEVEREIERQTFLVVTRPRNYWRQRWEGGRFVYATTQVEWEMWQLAREHLRNQQVQHESPS